ncbi:MAG TPA: YraN family protein, partial [Bacteroidales bacterium]
MAKHHELGKKGELIAIDFLKEKGFEILETNFRLEKDEIDIIAKDGATIVFVEVKTRSTNYFGEPEIAVGANKMEFLLRAAENYLISKNLNSEIRFDIISIVLNSRQKKIRHIVDAFYA